MSPFFEQVEPETAELLAVRAKAHELSVDAYHKLLLGIPAQKSALIELSEEEFEVVMEEFASGTEGVSSLPAQFSRTDIYCDHD